MPAWNETELSTFAAADDLHISPFREDGILDRVDAAYRVKYGTSPYLPPMLRDGPRSATVLLTPRY